MGLRLYVARLRFISHVCVYCMCFCLLVFSVA